MHEKPRARSKSFESIDSGHVFSTWVANTDSEFPIGQPLGYASNHKDSPLSQNVTVITSYRRGFSKIHFIIIQVRT